MALRKIGRCCPGLAYVNGGAVEEAAHSIHHS
jgi:hypothetical protein